MGKEREEVMSIIIKNGEIKITGHSFDSVTFLEKLCCSDEGAVSEMLSMISEFKRKHGVICENCGSLFISNNSKAKYCEACKQPEIMGKIRYRKRKSNKARKLHQDILSMAYRKNKEGMEVSDLFLNESNYYWDIVRNKIPKTERKNWYLDYIHSEEDYMEWLERKHFELMGGCV